MATSQTQPLPMDRRPGDISAVTTRLSAGSNTLNMGAIGTGKTYALSTWLQCVDLIPDLQLFYICTDPNGEESLLDSIHDRKLTEEMHRVHIHYAPPSSIPWDSMKNTAEMINKMSYSQLADLKQGIDKGKHDEFFGLLRCLANFTDSRTGEEYGPVDAMPPTSVVVIDGLSGINTMCRHLTVGGKPSMHQGEWGVAMNMEEELIYKLCADVKAFFVLIAHAEREMDETIGRPMNMPAALGRKLAPKIPRTFSDVVLSVREGTDFYWSTTAANFDLKTRTLPLRDKLEPSYRPIAEAWKRRNALALTQEEK